MEVSFKMHLYITCDVWVSFETKDLQFEATENHP
jgi:hypothetical protein